MDIYRYYVDLDGVKDACGIVITTDLQSARELVIDTYSDREVTFYDLEHVPFDEGVVEIYYE